jgi:hypothetical protein
MISVPLLWAACVCTLLAILPVYVVPLWVAVLLLVLSLLWKQYGR